MKRPTIIIAFILYLTSFRSFAQDVVQLMINNKSVGEITTGSSPAILTAQKSKYKTFKNVDLHFKQSQPNAAYKRSVEITNDQEQSIATINESTTKPGHYTVTSATILKKLQKENVLKVYLLQNPANNRMAMPSRRSLLAEVHMK